MAMARRRSFEARCETGVAGIDGRMGRRAQVGKTKLAFVSMPGLCGVTVGNPQRLGLAEDRFTPRRRGCRRSRWWTAVEEASTHCHPFPSTRAEVRPSHHLAAANFCGGVRRQPSASPARARILAIAPR